MLLVNNIREDREAVEKSLAKRNKDFSAILLEIIAKDDLRKKTQRELDDLLAEGNNIAKEIGLLFKSGQTAEV